MKAVLTTLCGCTKEMVIPFPPQREILIPIRSDRMRVWFDEDAPPPDRVAIRVRRFELRRHTGPYGTAEYVERAE
jgi:hypothetical protein